MICLKGAISKQHCIIFPIETPAKYAEIQNPEENN